MTRINEVGEVQPGVETSNFTGHNDQQHVPSNSLQNSIVSGADGQRAATQSGEGTIVTDVVKVNEPESQKTGFLGLTPTQIGFGVAGIAILGVTIYLVVKK